MEDLNALFHKRVLVKSSGKKGTVTGFHQYNRPGENPPLSVAVDLDDVKSHEVSTWYPLNEIEVIK